MRQIFYYTMRQLYYKLQQLLQNASILLQNAAAVTKRGVYYKTRQYAVFMSFPEHNKVWKQKLKVTCGIHMKLIASKH